MKLTAFLLIVGSLQVSATGFSQNVTLSVKNEPIEAVFTKIRQQTGYLFFYNVEWLKMTRNLTVELRNVPLREALDKCFEGQPLTYSIVDKTIVLQQKPPSTTNDMTVFAPPPPPPPPIKGRIVNGNGKPVAGASVVVKGKKTGTSTDENGFFTLETTSGRAVLVISSIGYTTVEKEVTGGETDLVISIAETSKDIGEVVVTALGITRTAKSLTYSSQKVGGDQINEARDANFTNTLSGKVAGLTITPSATGPGGATRVILRGNRSIQGINNALIVVDGVAVDNSSLPGQSTSDFGGQNGSDGAANINPDDIESITVLKGAAGAALYGSRAANGVIMIVTKRGRAGVMRVDVNSGATIDNPMIMPKLQNQYSQGSGGTYSAASESSFGAPVTGQSVTDWLGRTSNLAAKPNNIKDFFRSGSEFNNSVALNGGSDKIQTFFSYANSYTNGIIPTNYLSRNTFNLRMTAQISDRLSVDGKVTYVLQDIYNKPAVGGQGALYANLQRIPRTVGLNDIKDNYQKVSSSGIATPLYWATGEGTDMNPYWTLYNTHHNEDRSRLTALVSAKYKFTDWLNLQARVSSDSYNDFITQQYANNTLVFAPIAGGYYSEENDFVAERNVDFLLNGTNKITPDLKITYNLGGSVLSRQSRRRVSAANGLGVPNRFDLSFATNLVATTASVRRELESFYGTTQLSYKDFLFLDLTARNDWSSTLPEPYDYFYPSVGLTAILSDILRLPDWISLGKVRGSYSKVGNDADPYLLTQTYSYFSGAYGGYIGSNTVKSIGDLKPELTQSVEVGTEWRFFNDRFGFDLTYYLTKSKNQLLQVSSPPSSGYLSQYINAGSIQNSGVELMLSAKPIKTADFDWNIHLNYALNQNKVKQLYPGVSLIYLGSSTVRTSTPVVVVGEPYGDLYGYKWATVKGQHELDATGKPVATAAIGDLGNFNPKFTLGLTNEFRYKNWRLSVLVDGKFGGIVTSGSAAQFAFFGDADYTTKFRSGNWVIPGVQASGAPNTTPINAEQFWTTVSQGNYSWAEFFTYDATNVRLRELTLGYEFKHLPSAIKSARLSFVGRNLFFLYLGKSKMDIPGIGKRRLDFDPEVNLGTSNYQGVEYNNLPSTRNLGVNLKLSF